MMHEESLNRSNENASSESSPSGGSSATTSEENSGSPFWQFTIPANFHPTILVQKISEAASNKYEHCWVKKCDNSKVQTPSRIWSIMLATLPMHVVEILFQKPRKDLSPRPLSIRSTRSLAIAKRMHGQELWGQSCWPRQVNHGCHLGRPMAPIQQDKDDV